MRFIIDSIGRSKNILNRGAFQGRTTSHIEKTISIFETSLPVTLGNIQRNRLCRSKPLVARMMMKAPKILRYSERGSDINDREAINIQPIVIKDLFDHHQFIRVRVPLR